MHSTHPLQQFLYCPLCGAKQFEVHNEKAKACQSCGFIYYFNPSASVACFITNPKGELLLSKRAHDPAKGTLDLPGGFVDMHETAEEAARREVKEETGLTLTNCTYMFSIPNLYMYSGFEVQTLDLFFKCEVESFEGIKADDDVAELRVLPPTLLKVADFGLQSIRKAITIYQEQAKENKEREAKV